MVPRSPLGLLGYLTKSGKNLREVWLLNFV